MILVITTIASASVPRTRKALAMTTTVSPASRTHEGVDVPLPGTYEIDRQPHQRGLRRPPPHGLQDRGAPSRRSAAPSRSVTTRSTARSTYRSTPPASRPVTSGATTTSGRRTSSTSSSSRPSRTAARASPLRRKATSTSTASSPFVASPGRYGFRSPSRAPSRTRGGASGAASPPWRRSTAKTSGSPGIRCSKVAVSSSARRS